jgi:hypothetical protein
MVTGRPLFSKVGFGLLACFKVVLWLAGYKNCERQIREHYYMEPVPSCKQ